MVARLTHPSAVRAAYTPLLVAERYQPYQKPTVPLCATTTLILCNCRIVIIMSDHTVCVCACKNAPLVCSEIGSVNLHHNALTTQYHWGLQKFNAANISKPLKNIYCCSSINFRLFCSISQGVIPCPALHEKDPLLQSHSGLSEETVILNALSCFALWAPPTKTVWHITSWPLTHSYATP